MNQVELEVTVNYEFSQMLKALQKKGVYGSEESFRAVLTAISIESANRLFALGVSHGASLVDEQIGNYVYLNSCFCGHEKTDHVGGQYECSKCGEGMCLKFKIRGLVATGIGISPK